MRGHTPGPWTARKHGRGWSIHPPQLPGAALAECWRHPGKYTGLNYDAESNAHLIAAAPDLLRAAKRLLEKLDEYGDDGLPCPAEGLDLERAIDRAEGK